MSDQPFDRLQKVAGPVSRETFDRLKAFEALFRHWAARINLAAPSTLEDTWGRHILDSAQLIRLAPTANHWLDLGTGGGFPGVVVAILLKGRESGQADLVESNRKKAAFLQTAVAQTGAPGRVHACRIEQAAVKQPDILIARALAPLPQLFEFSERWLSTGSRALFHKGRGYRAEVEESRNAWRFDLVEHPNVVSSDGMILEITRLQRL